MNRRSDTSSPEPDQEPNSEPNSNPVGRESYQDICRCFDQIHSQPRARVGFHTERQDTSAPGWQHLLALIDEAAADGREEFRPLVELSPQERRQVVTLPPTIAKLTAVKHLMLYGSNLVRIPPEIGAMTSLEEFTPYTSYRLHWFPYEITRCTRLTRSTVSTRTLFGNYKLRPPFPRLQSAESAVAGLDTGDLDPRRWGTTAISSCSVCDRAVELGGLHPVWISLRVATDVLPLLVNACSAQCVAALPPSAEGYLQSAHTGGPVGRPSADRD
ncbi:leucine-rich repeat domain-containing protein [Streptomyces mirabilis]|uniref:leucine-rich repeat domain-containing protein n=1 Tax=Streptomyces mirabilis TaxID=68239 RepID=UPI0036601C5B